MTSFRSQGATAKVPTFGHHSAHAAPDPSHGYWAHSVWHRTPTPGLAGDPSDPRPGEAEKNSVACIVIGGCLNRVLSSLTDAEVGICFWWPYQWHKAPNTWAPWDMICNNGKLKGKECISIRLSLQQLLHYFALVQYKNIQIESLITEKHMGW